MSCRLDGTYWTKISSSLHRIGTIDGIASSSHEGELDDSVGSVVGVDSVDVAIRFSWAAVVWSRMATRSEQSSILPGGGKTSADFLGLNEFVGVNVRRYLYEN